MPSNADATQSSVEIRTPSDPASVRSHLERLLAKCNRDFYPAFTNRVTDPDPEWRDLADRHDISLRLATAIGPYVEDILEQEVVIALHPASNADPPVAGFMAYQPGYNPGLGPEYGNSIYLSVTAVDPDARRQGVAKAMNRHLLSEVFPELPHDVVVRRTWQSNAASRSLIKTLGFEEVERREGVRPGDVDVIYYARSLDS